MDPMDLDVVGNFTLKKNESRSTLMAGLPNKTLEIWVQGGPLPVISRVITPINGLINGLSWGYNSYKWSYNPRLITGDGGPPFFG